MRRAMKIAEKNPIKIKLKVTKGQTDLSFLQDI